MTPGAVLGQMVEELQALRIKFIQETGVDLPPDVDHESPAWKFFDYWCQAETEKVSLRNQINDIKNPF